MKISAIVPTYNNANFIEDAINSILVQSHSVDEIIIVDDGSTDNTAAVIDAITKKTTHKIIYIQQDNQGPSSARNRGIEAASGDWLAFLDADDLWTPEKITLQLSEIDRLGKLIVKSVLAKHQLLKKFQTLAGKPVPMALNALLKKNFIPTGTVLAERAIVIAAGGFNTNIHFGEDLELWAKIAGDHPITCLPNVMMQRRQHGNNATQSTARMLEGLVEVMRSLECWGADKLTKQNTNPNQLVANALCDLAYWHFVHCDYKQAREIFTSSLKSQLNKRALAYAAICLLPGRLIKRLKILKQCAK